MKNDNMVQGEESTSAHAYLYLMVDRVYVHSTASYIAGRLRGSRSSQPIKIVDNLGSNPRRGG